MREKLGSVFLVLVVGLSISCSNSQQEKARERAEEAKAAAQRDARRAEREARKLGDEAKQEAQVLNRKVTQAVKSGDARNAVQKLDRAALIAKIKARLAAQVGLSTMTSVDVDATGHIVTLRGMVSSEEQKREAGEIASQIDGVQRVVNDLRVER